MGYIRAEEVLPSNVLAMVQEYIDGQMLYVPKKAPERDKWGSVSGTKAYLQDRNTRIYDEYQAGSSVKLLSEKYFLSEKSIQRILRASRPSRSAQSSEQGGEIH